MNPGTQLGPYRVESLIGAGGMGEVYLGVDTRLDRPVAIKFLSGQLAADAALRERFQREARTISSLSHPNICTLFDLGRHEDSDYLVMEYLQGETLADRIAKGPLPMREVVRVGLGIASALEAAHKQGIVHRDLKPGNVMLTKGGVKLLDFGLAKLSSAAAGAEAPTAAFGETRQKPLTEQGVVLGTYQYMAPEQLEGLQADARSDLFALGAILFEMCTGKRAFDGKTRASVIAAIIDRDPPPMSQFQPLAPPALERVVRACLAKDPEERIQTAHDVALELRWLAESSSSLEAVEVKRRRRLTPWIAAAVFAAAAVAAGVAWWRERLKPPPAYTLSVLPPRGYGFVAAAISPDGKSLALGLLDRREGTRSLWVRRVDDGSERKLLDANVTSLFWSPDGKWIGFHQPPDRLMRIRPEGGPAELIATTEMQNQPVWGEDGTLLFSQRFGAGLFRVPATGGDPQPVTRLDASRAESIHTSPVMLPEGRFLYLSRTIAEKRNEIWASSLDGAKPRRVLAADGLIGYSRPWLLFARDGSAYAQRFDEDSLQVSGEAQRVIDDVQFSETEAQAQAFIGSRGAMIYGSFLPTPMQLNVYSRNGALVRTLWRDENIGAPSISPDGGTLLLVKFDRTKGATDIHTVDLARGVATRVTSGLAAYLAPQFSPDGQDVAFHSDRLGVYDIFVQPADGSSQPRVLWKDGRDKVLFDWAPDGKHLLVGGSAGAAGGDIWALRLGGGLPTPWLNSENNETDAVFSPDSRWVSYVVTRGQEHELYIRPFQGGRAVRVSTDGGGPAAWRADGRELIWYSKGRVLTASVDLSGPAPVLGKPQELFRLPQAFSRPFFTPAGEIALLVPAPDAQTVDPLHYTTAWRQRLDRKR